MHVRDFRRQPYGRLTVLFRRVRAGSDGKAHLWDLPARRRITSLGGHVARVSDVAVSPNGALVATASWDHTVRIWNSRSGRVLQTFEGHRSWVVGCRFTPDSRNLVTAAADGTVITVDVTSGRRVAEARVPTVLTGPVEINRSGRVLFVAAADHSVRVIRLRSGQQVGELRGHRDRVTACSLAPTGHLLATAGRDRTVRVWDLDDGREIAALTGHEDWVTGCAWPRPDVIASVSLDGTLRQWSRNHDVLLREVGPLRAGAAVPGTAHMVVTSEHGRMVEVNTSTRRSVGTLVGDSGWLDVVACSPDGRLMVTGSHNDDAIGQHPFRDGFGRPATLVEGVLLPGHRDSGALTELDWQRVHAICVDALGVVLSDEREQLVVHGGAAPRPAAVVSAPPRLQAGPERREITAGTPPAGAQFRGDGCALPAMVLAGLGVGGVGAAIMHLLG
ncbi:high-affnity carbon uptake protein Hat/HatR [Micromonospora sp. B006]|nr:high-affnity carbon uptake protein Hat/HatR [Micromonospora sp. B006]